MEKKIKKIRNLASWTGAQALMSSPYTQKEKNERSLILFVAEALEINPFGVNILGGLPYTNNIGRKEKMSHYDKNARFEYEWRRLSENDTDKAICAARIVTVKSENNGENIYLTDWIIGECSPATTKMSTLRGYQNHIAQTRAENRAFESAFGNKLRKEMFKNIQIMLSRGEVMTGFAEKAFAAGGPSAEEMGNEKPTKEIPMLAEKTAKSDPVQIASNFIMNAGSLSSLESAEKRIKESEEFHENNRAYLLGLVAKRKKQLK